MNPWLALVVVLGAGQMIVAAWILTGWLREERKARRSQA